MSRNFKVAALTFAAAMALAGCMRQEGSYVIHENNSVDGVIILALHEDYAGDPPSSGFDAEGIAAGFVDAVVTDLGQPNWVGDRIDFSGEPITSFSTPEEYYEIGVERVGDQFIVTGSPIDPEDAEMKQTIIDEGGSGMIRVTFPGEVLEHNGTVSGRTVTWDMLTQETAPYARAEAEAPEEPDPVVTVVISPSASPEATPSATEPEPSSTGAPSSGDDSSDGIPMWVWVVGGLLVAALAGLIGFTLANRKPKVPAAAPDAAEPPAATPPAEKK